LEQSAEKLISKRKNTKPPSEYPGKKDLQKYRVKTAIRGNSSV